MEKSIRTAISLTLLMALFVACMSFASSEQNAQTRMNSMGGNQDSSMIGNMSREEFDRRNQEGAAAVAAVTATNAPLSKADQKLMMDVAMGGMMQLEVSRVALSKATDDEARTLAQSEVEEQTGLSAKLGEIASAKNITLPSAPDSKTRAMVSKMQSMEAGAKFDMNYVKESGVKGHEKLDKVMSSVESKASDPALKSLAGAAHPLVLTHLQVSRAVVAKMSGRGMSGGGSNSRMSSNSNMMNGNGSMMNGNSNSTNRSNRNSNSMMNGNSNNNSNRF